MAVTTAPTTIDDETRREFDELWLETQKQMPDWPPRNMREIAIAHHAAWLIFKMSKKAAPQGALL